MSAPAPLRLREYARGGRCTRDSADVVVLTDESVTVIGGAK